MRNITDMFEAVTSQTTMTPTEIVDSGLPKDKKLKLIGQLSRAELLAENYIDLIKDWFHKNVKTEWRKRWFIKTANAADNVTAVKRIILDQEMTYNHQNACVTDVFYNQNTNRMCINLHVQDDIREYACDLLEFVRERGAKVNRGMVKFSSAEVASVMKEIYRAMIEYK